MPAKKPTESTRRVYPLVIVLSAVSIIEFAMVSLYPRLASPLERIPTLLVILSVPLLIVGTFIYLLIRKPGHLYPPSEFGQVVTPEDRNQLFNAFHESAASINQLNYYHDEHRAELAGIYKRLQTLETLANDRNA